MIQTPGLRHTYWTNMKSTLLVDNQSSSISDEVKKFHDTDNRPNATLNISTVETRTASSGNNLSEQTISYSINHRLKYS